MTLPTPPIERTGSDDRFVGATPTAPPSFLRDLAAVAEVVTDLDARAEAGRDWWPLALHWSLDGAVPRKPLAVVRPSSTEEVSAAVRVCAEAGIPITPAGGRSCRTGDCAHRSCGRAVGRRFRCSDMATGTGTRRCIARPSPPTHPLSPSQLHACLMHESHCESGDLVGVGDAGKELHYC